MPLQRERPVSLNSGDLSLGNEVTKSANSPFPLLGMHWCCTESASLRALRLMSAQRFSPLPTLVIFDQVMYDPSEIAYEDLLSVFWKENRPWGRQPKAQYKSAIWPTTDEQMKAALVSLERAREANGSPLFVDIEPAREWFDAEEYHQVSWSSWPYH